MTNDKDKTDSSAAAPREAQKKSILTTLVNSGIITVWTWDLDTNVITLYDQDTKNGKKFDFTFIKNSLEPDDVERILAAGQKVAVGMSTREVVRAVSRHYDDAEAELSITPLVTTASGAARVLLGVQRKVPKETIRREHELIYKKRYESILDAALTDVFVYDITGQLLLVNNRARNAYHLPDNATLREQKMNIRDLPWFDALDIEETIGRAFTSCNPQHTSYFKAQTIPVYDADGKIECICLKGNDVTGTAISAKNSKRYTRLTRNGTERLNSLLERANYAIRSAGIRLVTYHPDERKIKFWGTLAEVQREIDEMEIYTLADANAVQSMAREMMKMDRKENSPIEFSFKYSIDDRFPTETYMQCKGRPITDAKGRIKYYFGVVSDETQLITTRLKLEEERNRARERDRVKDAFLQNMTNEITEPMQTVVHCAGRMASDGSDDEQLIKDMRRNTDKMLKIVDNVLLLSRLDANMVESKIQETDIPDLFEGVYKGVASRNEGRGIELAVENMYQQFTATLDANNFEEAVTRTLDSLSKMLKGGRIYVRYEYIGGTITVFISNDDVTVKPEWFYMDKNVVKDNAGAVRLDLTIARMLTQLAGGSVKIDNKKSGTGIWLSVPCKVSALKEKTMIYR